MKNKMEEMENIYKGVQGHLREIDPLAKHSHVQMTEVQINSCSQENVNPELSMKLMDFHTQVRTMLKLTSKNMSKVPT